MKKIILGILSFILVLSVTGCGGTKVLNVSSQKIDEKKADTDVYKAIKRAGAGLGWIIKKVDNNTAIATLNIRTHQAVAVIKYTNKDYSIDYKSSTGLKYNAEKNTIHKAYNGWIRNLNNAIQLQLSL